MRNAAKLMFQVLRVFLLFAACTIMFYYGIIWVSQEYENYRRYDEPEGTAIKVIQQNSSEEESDWFSRLLFFYLNGE
ncbi:DUF4227 family protein [Siminovitchia acidinfaciens]|uniref:DUF4227 family protein n=1 Tax=Siminovitchia acidinfaciens TaxID=2321395 RepID=A0A429XYA3_9BACI|nr:YqzK family protein [Siminovitchia acidinfaciens]RST73723.1 DUF4227 family protein [Siminovitchia acidinfaciens]VEF47904.1 Uncharacterized membrane protein yqzK [Bacillus freudenreichii]